MMPDEGVLHMYIECSIILLGVMLVLDFILKKLFAAAANKRFLIYMLLFLSMSFAHFFITAATFSILHFFNISKVYAACMVGALSVVFAVSIYIKCLRKENKSNSLLFRKFVKQLLAATVLSYITVCAFCFGNFLLDVNISLLIKIPLAMLSVCLTILSFISFSDYSLQKIIIELLKDEAFNLRINEVKSQGYYRLQKENVDKAFLWQLDFGIYEVINKNTLLNLKDGETEIVRIPKTVIDLVEKLKPEKN